MEKSLSITSAFKYVLKSIARLCALLLFLVISNEVIFYFSLNVWPGHGDYLIEIERKADQYDRYFLGSSRTELSINTPLFDRLQNNGVSSFNLGSSNQTLIDQYLTLENLISSGKEIKECVFELILPAFDNYYKPVSYTQALPEVIRFSAQLPTQVRYDFLTDVLKKRFRLLFTHYSNNAILDSVNSKQGYRLQNPPFRAYRGTEERKTDIAEPITLNDDQKETLLITQLILQRITERCQKSNIRLLFLLPVQIGVTELPLLNTLWANLPPAQKWETSEQLLWQELRQPQFWRDFLHTNEAGAVLYTKILSDTYPPK